MSSYPNYNSIGYPNSQNEQNSRRNRQPVQQRQQQPVQPPQGYMGANYSWNNQNANRSYSSTNDAYSRAQDPSSSFAHLPAALGSYSQQGRRTDETTQRSGLNSLVYASSLHQNSGTSQSNVGSQGSSTSNQYQSATGYNYPSQSNSAASTQATSNYDQQPQQASSAASRTSATSYTYQNTAVNNDGMRPYHTQSAHTSQPERRPSPKVNQRQRKPATHKSPPVTHSSTSASLNAPSYSQTSHGYSSYTAHTSSVANPSHTVTSTETLPTVTQDYPQAAETKTTEQISPSKVQYINPTDLYTQQYFLAQERARAEEAEKMEAEEARKREAEAQAHSQAEAVARAAEEASSSNAQVTPTSAAKGKAAEAKPGKNTSKKRISAKQKAAEKDAASADPLDAEGDDDMAFEMRRMLEKLRGMRSKDPSLFAKLWDDFKKPAASTQAAATPPPPPPAAGPNPSTIKPSPSTRTPSKTPKSPGVSQEKEMDGLPDLGRFPAQRRRRQKKSDAAEVVTANSQLDASAPVAQVNVSSMLNQQHQQSPAPVSAPVTKKATAKTQQKASTPAPSASKPKATPAQEATWPAATQQKLAKAASEYLSKDAANQGKECSPESLMLLLRNNPTYPDLCAQLESRGFVLDRQAMARFLLAAVPALLSGNNGQDQKKAEVNKNTPPAQASPSLPPTTMQPPTQPPQHPLYLPPQPPQPAQPIQSSQPAPPTQSTVPPLPPLPPVPPLPHGVPTSDLDVVFYHPGVPAPKPRGPNPNSGPADQKGGKNLQRPRRSDGAWISNTPVGPKAEMAKKRLFSEIVDMSQVSSDEEEMPSDYDDDDEDGFSNRPTPSMNLNVYQPPTFPDPGPDPMDIDTDSSHAVDQNLPDSRGELPEPDIEFDPDDEFVLREIKRRHPSERPLNFHLMHFTQTFLGVTMRSDLETFKWDLVDPGGPSMPVVELEDILVEPPQLTRKKRRRRHESRDDPDVKGPTSDSRPQPSQTTTIATPGQPPSTSVSAPHGARDSMAGTPTTGQRTGRRGRPPGAKNKNPTKAALKALAKTTAGSSTRNAQRTVPAPATSVPEPSYPMFTCEWASCPAQLHDVHTLERHVFKNHIEGQQTCLWQNCPNFATEYVGEGLKEHLAKAHIQPLAWKYGDGPSVNGTVSFDLDRYLNANGLIVTPDATTAGESDALIFPVEPTPIRAFNKLHGDQKPSERARQVLRAVQKRRKRVGIGLEQEGCEFSTPVRNKLFVNDEEYYEVIADEEEGTDDWFSQGDNS
ncbi:C2H2 finger domain protein [Talaromyces pinophilus]|uniref:C2H2 finger domain protein n=1 Tax=Talaromyces pinophilus TaxID=128442 RepID=A0A6V8HAP5_TALPI|nr:C2H2 finger domain protein [Talaromyces pinophilus]